MESLESLKQLLQQVQTGVRVLPNPTITHRGRTYTPDSLPPLPQVRLGWGFDISKHICRDYQRGVCDLNDLQRRSISDNGNVLVPPAIEYPAAYVMGRWPDLSDGHRRNKYCLQEHKKMLGWREIGRLDLGVW